MKWVCHYCGQIIMHSFGLMNEHPRRAGTHATAASHTIMANKQKVNNGKSVIPNYGSVGGLCGFCLVWCSKFVRVAIPAGLQNRSQRYPKGQSQPPHNREWLSFVS
jgi:hypothetical protein